MEGSAAGKACGPSSMVFADLYEYLSQAAGLTTYPKVHYAAKRRGPFLEPVCRDGRCRCKARASYKGHRGCPRKSISTAGR